MTANDLINDDKIKIEIKESRPKRRRDFPTPQ